MPARKWALPGLSFQGWAFRCLASHRPGFPTAGFAHPAGYGGAERCSAKPRLRPLRATFFLASPRKKAKKATRLHRSAFGRLPCAAHNGRPAQNSPFGLRQLRRTSPPVALLLGGSDGLTEDHRASPEADMATDR